MTRPNLTDDGQTVTLDLHGLTVRDALELTDSLIVQAARYGRMTVRIVHGTSTTDAGAARTIKTALYDTLDRGDFERHVTTEVRMDAMLLLGLAPAPNPMSGRITLTSLR